MNEIEDLFYKGGINAAFLCPELAGSEYLSEAFWLKGSDVMGFFPFADAAANLHSLSDGVP